MSFLEAWALARVAGEDALAVDAAHMLGIVEPGHEGWAWNQRAMGLARSSPAPGARRWIASLANNMGWARHDAGRYGEALELFRLALDERRREGESRRTRIARWCVARCLRSLDRVEEALTEQRSIAAELEAAGEVDGFVDEEIGACLLALGRVDEARPFLGRAYAELSGDAGLQADEPERLERLRSLG
jgi:tetratricopeptide (TPR) repeat protein